MQPLEPVDPRIEIAYTLAQRLLFTLAQKSVKTTDKYLYYNADNDVTDFGISTPLRMRQNRPGIGWASRAVNTLADRVVFDGFANDKFSINATLDEINGTSVIAKSKHDAFIAGCSFVMVGDKPDGSGKVLVPFTAIEATGEIDQTSGLLRYGLAVTKWEGTKNYPIEYRNRWGLFSPKNYTLFTPDFTAIFVSRTLYEIVENNTGRCLLHPLTHRASADRPLGRSRITNTVRRIIQEVTRQKRREEIAEEFYSHPQRYMLGIAEGAEKDSSMDSAIGKMWVVNKDEDGDSPTVGQLSQLSLDGFEKAKKDKARDFCAETGLTLRNLGYETANPTSAESLSAMSDDLLLEAQNSQDDMGKQIKEIAITLRLALDDNNVIPEGLKDIVPAWKPIFQLDVGAAGDSLYKLTTVAPELLGSMAFYRMLGISVREAEQLVLQRKANTAASFMNNGGAK